MPIYFYSTRDAYGCFSNFSPHGKDNPANDAIPRFAPRPVSLSTGEGPATRFAETGYGLSGEFLRYWRANGGLPVFGYSIGSVQPVNGRAVQYLERARFEYQLQNKAPYIVLLGRLGVEAFQRQGRDWQSLPKAATNAPRYFRQTVNCQLPYRAG